MDDDFTVWCDRVKASPEDVVAWLRRMAVEVSSGYAVAGPAKRFTEAADEIERQRSSINEFANEIMELRTSIRLAGY